MTASGPMRGSETERGNEGYFKVVGTVGNLLGESKGKGNGDGSDVLFGIVGRHGGGGGAGSRKQGKRLKWGVMERGECG